MHGFERECIRVTPDGLLAPTPHPEGLGFSLTHPYITTDFSESQLEFITLPEHSLQLSLDRLRQIHIYTAQALNGELIWPLSMPPRLPDRDEDIPVAVYGSSDLATKKTVYRRGIGHRYGRRKQTVSGVHYNLSLEPSVMNRMLPGVPGADASFSVSDACFHIIRNLYRRMPFFTYLFGASPAFDRSYDAPENAMLKAHKSDTLYSEFATSIRLSGMGYTSDVQKRLQMSYDSLDSFVRDLAWALNTCNPDYLAFSTDEANQLNPNYLQNEQELYALFRPKQEMRPGERLLDALQDRGAGYTEIRLLDADPEYPEGIDPSAIGFFHMAVLDCLKRPSPPLSSKESKELNDVNQEVVWRGRQKGLRLPIEGPPSPFHDLGRRYCEGLYPLAEEMDSAEGADFYRESLGRQMAKWGSPELTPSGRHLANLLDNDKEFLELGLDLAVRNAERLSARAPDMAFQQEIDRQTRKSRDGKE